MDWHTHVRICVADKRKWKINKQTNKCAIEEHLSFCGFQVAGAEQQENQLNNKMTIAIIYINLKAYFKNCPFIRCFASSFFPSLNGGDFSATKKSHWIICVLGTTHPFTWICNNSRLKWYFVIQNGTCGLFNWLQVQNSNVFEYDFCFPSLNTPTCLQMTQFMLYTTYPSWNWLSRAFFFLRHNYISLIYFRVNVYNYIIFIITIVEKKISL